jgi:hypothetical protein
VGSWEWGKSYCARDRRRKRIAYLPVCGCFPSRKLPFIIKSLQSRRHACGEPGFPYKILFWRIISKPMSINAQ